MSLNRGFFPKHCFKCIICGKEFETEYRNDRICEGCKENRIRELAYLSEIYTCENCIYRSTCEGYAVQKGYICEEFKLDSQTIKVKLI
jgi:ribosomal protein L37AE/L43A